MISKTCEFASPGHQNANKFIELFEYWRNSKAKYFSEKFCLSALEPWLLTGETPFDWMTENRDLYRRTVQDILDLATLYEPATVPNAGGIYFLLIDDDIVYVGQSGLFQRRLWQHYESGKEFNRYAVIPDIPGMFLDDTEAFYINWLLPRYNVKVPPMREIWIDDLERLQSQ